MYSRLRKSNISKLANSYKHGKVIHTEKRTFLVILEGSLGRFDSKRVSTPGFFLSIPNSTHFLFVAAAACISESKYPILCVFLSIVNTLFHLLLDLHHVTPSKRDNLPFLRFLDKVLSLSGIETI